MKRAIKEYGEILKLSGKWLSKHWKGYTIFSLTLGGVVFIFIEFKEIVDFVRTKLKIKTSKES